LVTLTVDITERASARLLSALRSVKVAKALGAGSHPGIVVRTASSWRVVKERSPNVITKPIT
jgi:hypothetical protein